MSQFNLNQTKQLTRIETIKLKEINANILQLLMRLNFALWIDQTFTGAWMLSRCVTKTKWKMAKCILKCYKLTVSTKHCQLVVTKRFVQWICRGFETFTRIPANDSKSTHNTNTSIMIFYVHL